MTADNSDELDRSDMARLASGDDAALNDLMERHGHKLFHYLIRLLHDEEEAADLAQETFVRVYRTSARFRTGSRFSTWLYTIATNLARDRLRWQSRHPRVPLNGPSGNPGPSLAGVLASPNLSPSETLEAAERADAVRRAVADLPEELRVPLVLAEYEGQSQAEIAAVLNCSAKAVEMRIYRARKELREKFSEWLKDFE